MACCQPPPWLPVSRYHGFQSAYTMASGQLLPRLPVSLYHGFQSAATMASSQPLPWLPVSLYNSFQSATTMAAAVLVCLAAWQAAAQKHSPASSFIIFCRLIAFFQVLCLCCIRAGTAWSSSAMAQLQEHHLSNTCFVGQVLLNVMFLRRSRG